MHNDEISYKPVALDWIDELTNPDFAKAESDLVGVSRWRIFETPRTKNDVQDAFARFWF